jgi:hypothetical protein
MGQCGCHRHTVGEAGVIALATCWNESNPTVSLRLLQRYASGAAVSGRPESLVLPVGFLSYEEGYRCFERTSYNPEVTQRTVKPPT